MTAAEIRTKCYWREHLNCMVQDARWCATRATLDRSKMVPGALSTAGARAPDPADCGCGPSPRSSLRRPIARRRRRPSFRAERDGQMEKNERGRTETAARWIPVVTATRHPSPISASRVMAEEPRVIGDRLVASRVSTTLSRSIEVRGQATGEGRAGNDVEGRERRSSNTRR